MNSIRFTKLFMSSVAAFSLTMTSPVFAGGPGFLAKLAEEAAVALAGVMVKSADNAARSVEQATADQIGIAFRSSIKALNIDTSSEEAFNASLKALGDSSEAVAFRNALDAAKQMDASTVMNLSRKANALLVSKNTAVDGMSQLLKEANELVVKHTRSSPVSAVSDEAASALGGMTTSAAGIREITDVIVDGSPLEKTVMSITDQKEIAKILAIVRAVTSKRPPTGTQKALVATPEQKKAFQAIFANRQSTYGKIELGLIMKDMTPDEQKTLLSHLDQATAQNIDFFDALRATARANQDEEALKVIDGMVDDLCFT